MQWNTRGDRYTIPKAVAGSANGRVKGGGKGGWGNQLILAEDQKEYGRAVVERERAARRDVVDEDWLPAFVSGAKARQGEKVRVGAGRTVNSRKR